MWIVNRQLQGIRTLNGGEIALIKSYLANTVAGIDVVRSTALLREVRSQHHWLTCGCTNPAPVMHVALLDTGRLVIRNNQNGPEHSAGCDFARQIAVGSARSQSKAAVVVKQQPDDLIRLHSNFSNAGAGKGSSTVSGKQQTSQPKKRLLSLLLTLMDMAELNRYDPADPQDNSAQFKALRDAADRLTVHPGIPLSRFFDTRVRKDRLFYMAKRLRESTDFGTNRKVGLMMDVIAGTAGRTIKLSNGDELDFFGSVERNFASHNPSLVLATVTTQQAGSKFFELGQLAVVPVASRNVMFPVGAGEDPKDVVRVLELLDWLQRKGVRVVAVRYLFTSEGGSLIELRHTQKIVTLNLAEGQPKQDFDDDKSAAPGEVLERCNYRDIDQMKRHIAKVFLELDLPK
jgi:hypothetical protein